MTLWQSLDEITDNQIGAAFICGVVLIATGMVYPPGWAFVFSATLSYVAFDAIMSFFLRYGDGWVKIGLSNSFQTRGKAFLVFFWAIVGGTAVITWLLNHFVPDSGVPIFWMLYGTGFAILAVFTESWIRFQGVS